jgi:hypothetical protein
MRKVAAVIALTAALVVATAAASQAKPLRAEQATATVAFDWNWG